MDQEIMQEVIQHFRFPEHLKEEIPYGSGHINDTFRLTFEGETGKPRRFILQRMNKDIFLRPVELMENIVGVTTWLRGKIIANGGDPERETLNLVTAADGNCYYRDSAGDYWRAYLFIEDAVCYNQVEKPEDFYESALAFGHFQRLLADYPAKTLHETIKDFHNTEERFLTLQKAIREDVCKRADKVKDEIAFALSRESLAHTLCRMQKSRELPLRVTHNDTKLNNIMMDNATGKGICVIDLDTVMPGLAVNDFGDSIRFGASTGAEDERDLSKIWCSLELFEAYTKGFLEGCGGSLTQEEICMLPDGAITMTYECGIRFLTDYLSGDTYFKTHREGQNLDRCRTQFKLVADMEQKKQQMYEIIANYAKIKTV